MAFLKAPVVDSGKAGGQATRKQLSGEQKIVRGKGVWCISLLRGETKQSFQHSTAQHMLRRKGAGDFRFEVFVLNFEPRHSLKSLWISAHGSYLS